LHQERSLSTVSSIQCTFPSSPSRTVQAPFNAYGSPKVSTCVLGRLSDRKCLDFQESSSTSRWMPYLSCWEFVHLAMDALPNTSKPSRADQFEQLSYSNALRRCMGVSRRPSTSREFVGLSSQLQVEAVNIQLRILPLFL